MRRGVSKTACLPDLARAYLTKEQIVGKAEELLEYIWKNDGKKKGNNKSTSTPVKKKTSKKDDSILKQINWGK